MAADLVAGVGPVWVVDPNGNSVWVIDPRTDQVVRTIGVGNNPQGVVVGSGSVWVATAAGAVVRIDPKELPSRRNDSGRGNSGRDRVRRRSRSGSLST